MARAKATRAKPAKARPAKAGPAKVPKPPPDWRFLKYEHGGWGLLLYAHGYTWENLARPIVKKLGLAKLIDFNPEAGMFAAYAEERTTLEKLRDALEPLRADRDAFKRAVAKAPPD